MAIFHLQAQILKRSAGRSATAAAAYRAHERIEDERTGLTHDYTRRRGEVEAFILAPDQAPDWAHDRAALWNHVEAAEKRKDSQICREINVALPVELTQAQQRDLIERYTKNIFVDEGMIADVAIHRDHPENPHAHIMLTMREIGPEGFGKKFNNFTSLSEFGQRRDELVYWRQAWEGMANSHLKLAGHDVRIDHRSLEAQGIDRMPTIHEGAAVRQMEAQGIQTERGDHNRMVKEHAEIVAEQKQNVINFEDFKRQKEALKQELEAAIQITPEPPKQKSIPELLEQKIQVQKERSDLESDRMKYRDLSETRRLIALNQQKAQEAREKIQGINAENGLLDKITPRFLRSEKWKERMHEKRLAEISLGAAENYLKELEEKLPPQKEISRLEEIAPKLDSIMDQLNGLIKSIDKEIEERHPPRSRQAKQKKSYEQGRGMSR